MNALKVGTPYAFPSNPPETFDCWSLVLYARAGLGLQTPLAIDTSDVVPDTFADAVRRELRGSCWREADRPVDGDVVVFKPDHVGVWMGGKVVHAAPGAGVQVTRLASVRRRFPRAVVVRPA